MPSGVRITDEVERHAKALGVRRPWPDVGDDHREDWERQTALAWDFYQAHNLIGCVAIVNRLNKSMREVWRYRAKKAAKMTE